MRLGCALLHIVDRIVLQLSIPNVSRVLPDVITLFVAGMASNDARQSSQHSLFIITDEL